MCLSPRVAMDRSQKLINPFVSETTESAVFVYVLYYCCDWNLYGCSIQHNRKIWNSSFLFAISSISKRTTCFHFDDSPIFFTHTQQVVSMFVTTYLCEKLFFKLKHAKITLRSWNCRIITCVKCCSCQPPHLALILQIVIANNIRCLINKLWLLPCEFSCYFFYPFKIVALGSPRLSFVALELKRLRTPDLEHMTETLR